MAQFDFFTWWSPRGSLRSLSEEDFSVGLFINSSLGDSGLREAESKSLLQATLTPRSVTCWEHNLLVVAAAAAACLQNLHRLATSATPKSGKVALVLGSVPRVAEFMVDPASAEPR